MKNTVRKAALFAVVLTALVLMLSAVAMAATPNVYHNGSYTAQKLSNPTTGEGQEDGLETPADRQNSYAWSMARLTDKYGDYVYIGSNRNLIYFGVSNMLPGSGDQATLKQLNQMIVTLTNGEIMPSSSKADLHQAAIVRYNLKTGEMETWFDSADHAKDNNAFSFISGFRAVTSFKGQLYFNANSYVAGSHIYRIKDNSQTMPEIVLSETNGGFLRAMNVSADGNTLYIGGTKKFLGRDDIFDIVVYESTSGNEGSFKQIADCEDFAPYNRSAIRSSSGDVWDMVEYQGKLYFTIMTLDGGMVFRGHEAKGDPNANDYDWVWEEVAGNDPASPYGPGFGNPLNYTLTPYVFNGDLYFISFSDAMDALIEGSRGLVQYLSGDKDINYFFDSLTLMDKVMENETAVFRLTKKGEMQMVVGDKSDCPESIQYVAKMKAGFNSADRSTTCYNWRATIYDGKFYIGTMDSYAIFKYLTKLTNGDLLNMSAAEFRQQLEYVKQFLEMIQEEPDGDEKKLEAAPAKAAQAKAADPAQDALQQVAALYKAEEDQLPAAKLAAPKAAAPKPGDVEIEALFGVLTLLQQSLDKDATTAFISQMLLSIPDAAQRLDVLYHYLDYLKTKYPEYTTIIEEVLQPVYQLSQVLGSINEDGLKRYVRISDTIAADDNPGFELYSTTDGVNYETVTLDGFGDEYNYGCRTLLTVDDGVLVGTANPFFGAQLWKVTEKGRTPVKPTPPDPEEEDDFPFTDVHKGDWSYNDIYYVWQQGLMSGTSDTLFSPDKPLTRGMVIAILYRMEGKPAFRNANVFTDVPAGSYYEKAIVWANGKGIAKGVAADKFAPDRAVTRQQLAAFLYRYAQYKGLDVSVGQDTNILSFDDASSVSTYAIPAVSWAVGSNIIKGSNNCLLPKNTATRAEAAAMFHRFDLMLDK